MAKSVRGGQSELFSDFQLKQELISEKTSKQGLMVKTGLIQTEALRMSLFSQNMQKSVTQCLSDTIYSRQAKVVSEEDGRDQSERLCSEQP